MPTYYLRRDRSAFVPEATMGPKNGIDESDIDRLGLRDLLDAFLAPAASPEPEPEPPKMAPRAADKMVRRHADKRGR